MALSRLAPIAVAVGVTRPCLGPSCGGRCWRAAARFSHLCGGRTSSSAPSSRPRACSTREPWAPPRDELSLVGPYRGVKNTATTAGKSGLRRNTYLAPRCVSMPLKTGSRGRYSVKFLLALRFYPSSLYEPCLGLCPAVPGEVALPADPNSSN